MVWKLLKPYSMPLKTFLCSIVPFLSNNKLTCESAKSRKKGENWSMPKNRKKIVKTNFIKDRKP